MLNLLRYLSRFILSKIRITSILAAENLALRQQLAVMKRTNKRPKLLTIDKIFWVLFLRISSSWNKSLIIVQPSTVVRWHKRGFKHFWKVKCRVKGRGRPRSTLEIRNLIKKMALTNPSWGAPRIHGELLRLEFDISERTVSSLMPKLPPSKKQSQNWRTFLNNHVNTCSMDFFTVPTATFKILYVLVILHHNNRKVMHFNVTSNPTAQWTAQQVVEAFPGETAPKYLMRDRDAIYGEFFRNRVKNMGIQEVISAPRSPWQNPFVERLIGSIRRECLDKVVVLNNAHLKNVLSSYFQYYHDDRTHLGIDKRTPNGRSVQSKPTGKCTIIALPRCGGLHHRYEWKKAA